MSVLDQKRASQPFKPQTLTQQNLTKDAQEIKQVNKEHLQMGPELTRLLAWTDEVAAQKNRDYWMKKQFFSGTEVGVGVLVCEDDSI